MQNDMRDKMFSENLKLQERIFELLRENRRLRNELKVCMGAHKWENELSGCSGELSHFGQSLAKSREH